MTSIIKANNLSRYLDGDIPVRLVEDINLEIYQGQFTVINGPSGSGKSSLLYLLGLLDAPTSGEVQIANIFTSELNDNQLADFRLEKIGFVFQFHFLLPEFTALENVTLPILRLGKVSTIDAKNRANTLLSNFGLSDHANKLPKQLSGGQSQRVAVARALANNPDMILADEPSGNLDTVSSEQVQSIMSDLAHKENKAVVVVSHEERFAKLADRLITIVDGRVRKDSVR